MSELKDETLQLGCDVYFHANHWELFPTEISICRDSQYDNQDDIDVDISKGEAIKIVNFLQEHYKLEKGGDK